MALRRKELTNANIGDLIFQLNRRMTRLEKVVRNLIVDDDSASFQSVVTSRTGGKGSDSANWSSSHSFNPINTGTTGTGSESISLPDGDDIPGA